MFWFGLSETYRDCHPLAQRQPIAPKAFTQPVVLRKRTPICFERIAKIIYITKDTDELLFRSRFLEGVLTIFGRVAFFAPTRLSDTQVTRALKYSRPRFYTYFVEITENLRTQCATASRTIRINWTPSAIPVSSDNSASVRTECSCLFNGGYSVIDSAPISITRLWYNIVGFFFGCVAWKSNTHHQN